ncbi:hypothetical protein ES703_91627 [subsurface metagenome]
MVAKGPFMEFLRHENPGAADGILEEIAINLPTSGNENLAVLIHQIDLMVTIPSGGTENLGAVSLVSYIHAAEKFPSSNEAGMLMKREVYMVVSGEAGQFFQVNQEHFMKYFSPPLLVAKDKIYILSKATGCEGKSVKVIIGYTLEKVTKDDFIDALVGSG